MKDSLRKDFVHSELSYQIIGCAFSVYNSIGPGHIEKVYQKSLASAFRNAGLKFLEQAECPVIYEGEKVGTGYADFLVEEKILVELKRDSYFNPSDFNQLKKYLAARKLQLGLMIRFAPEQLMHKRVVDLYHYSNGNNEVREPEAKYLSNKVA
ncbi:MAG TPA: GxxExxY protein [Bacteroidia bacterium]|jgi:GxxExxY protein|nr:GxxExxY protein [Bacteroidia bacterium]